MKRKIKINLILFSGESSNETLTDDDQDSKEESFGNT